ncbi:MAG: hypothetical protein JST73_13165, partial [Actinobacteria bacterium]|nr:hypothetical protein [Actinomycetota bacterium]
PVVPGHASAASTPGYSAPTPDAASTYVSPTPTSAYPSTAYPSTSTVGAPAPIGVPGVVDRNLRSIEPLLDTDESVELRGDFHYGSIALTQRRVVAITYPDDIIAELLWKNANWIATMHARRAVTFYAYRKFFSPGRIVFGAFLMLVGLAAAVGGMIGTVVRTDPVAIIGIVIGLLFMFVGCVLFYFARMARIIAISDAGFSTIRVRANERDRAIQFVAAAASTLGRS